MTPETLPARPHIAILGAGSWGSALAILLAPAASSVAVYARSPEALRSINDDHANPRYLPGASLPPTVTAGPSLSAVSPFSRRGVAHALLRSAFRVPHSPHARL